MKSDDTMMDTPMQIQRRADPPWKDWEDHGGYDDEETLLGSIVFNKPALPQDRPWYYEKKRYSPCQPITVCIQMTFL